MEQQAGARPTKVQDMSESEEKEEVRPASPETSYSSAVTEGRGSSVGEEPSCSPSSSANFSSEPGPSDRPVERGRNLTAAARPERARRRSLAHRRKKAAILSEDTTEETTSGSTQRRRSEKTSSSDFHDRPTKRKESAMQDVLEEKRKKTSFRWLFPASGAVLSSSLVPPPRALPAPVVTPVLPDTGGFSSHSLTMRSRKKETAEVRMKERESRSSAMEQQAGARPTKVQDMSESEEKEEVRPASPETSYSSAVTEGRGSSVGEEPSCSPSSAANFSSEPGPSDRPVERGRNLTAAARPERARRRSLAHRRKKAAILSEDTTEETTSGSTQRRRSEMQDVLEKKRKKTSLILQSSALDSDTEAGLSSSLVPPPRALPAPVVTPVLPDTGDSSSHSWPFSASGSFSEVEMAPSDDFQLLLDPGVITISDSSEDMDAAQTLSLFTPDILNERGAISYRFRSPCPGVYQCDSTGLVFTMTRDGELLYRIVRWEEDRLSAAGKSPAGPLFDIRCSEDAVSQLHLPHCETTPALSSGLSVVHISEDGVDVLELREITDTHVVVDVPHLSVFGLVLDIIRSFLSIQRPIRGQVLLFHQPANTGRSQKLNVFLLPENVPVCEVKAQQEKAEYIEAPSTCSLVKGQKYSLHCSEASRVQPAFALFDFNYGPNYHLTFEIRLTPSTEEVTVKVRDQEKIDVWEYHAELTGLKRASSSAALSAQPPATEPAEGGQDLPRTGEEERKLFSVRTEFIERVSSPVLKYLLDELLQNRVINTMEMESIQAMSRADKARELIDTVLRKGNAACRILIDTFCEVDPFVSALLQLNRLKKEETVKN